MNTSEIIDYIKCKVRGEVPTKILIQNGLKVGSNFKRLPGCALDISHCWLISIGDNVTLAPNVRILAHDASMKNELGYTKIGRVTIGNNVFIGAGSIILPNVRIGDNCIIGAGTVVTKDVETDSVVAGNPAKFICKKSDFIEKNRVNLETKAKYDESWTIRGNISEENKIKMRNDLVDSFGYVE